MGPGQGQRTGCGETQGPGWPQEGGKGIGRQRDSGEERSE